MHKSILYFKSIWWCIVCVRFAKSTIYQAYTTVTCWVVFHRQKLRFLKLKDAFSRTTGPILGLFVLTWMHCYAASKYGNENTNYSKILKKFVKRNKSSTLDIRTEKVTASTCGNGSYRYSIFQFQLNQSRTTAPILGLFVLIWIYLSCWIQIRQWKIKI